MCTGYDRGQAIPHDRSGVETSRGWNTRNLEKLLPRETSSGAWHCSQAP